MQRNPNEDSGAYEMDKNEIIKLVNVFGEKINKILPVKEVILYGSWAAGNEHYDSDIDVAVFLEKDFDNYLDTEKLLYKSRRDIDLRIEPVLVSDTLDSSGFAQMVKRKGVHVYP